MKFLSDYRRGVKDGNRNEYFPPSVPVFFPSQSEKDKKAAYDKGYKEGLKQRSDRHKTRR